MIDVTGPNVQFNAFQYIPIRSQRRAVQKVVGLSGPPRCGTAFVVLLLAMSSDVSYRIRSHSYHSFQVHRNADLLFLGLLPGMSGDAGICRL